MAMGFSNISNTDEMILPDSEMAMDQVVLLKNYEELMNHFVTGTLLNVDFPVKIKQEFPSEVYKNLLKTRLEEVQGTIKNNLKVHCSYLRELNVICMYYSSDIQLPNSLKEEVVERFPNKHFLNELRQEIKYLQRLIEAERSAI